VSQAEGSINKQKAVSTRIEICHLFADRITPLGKRPVIASLSIGATRIFRVKRAAGGSDEADTVHAASKAYDIPEQDTPEVSQVAEPHEISPCLY